MGFSQNVLGFRGNSRGRGWGFIPGKGFAGGSKRPPPSGKWGVGQATGGWVVAYLYTGNHTARLTSQDPENLQGLGREASISARIWASSRANPSPIYQAR